MKIEVPLLNAIRFPVGADTVLHLETDDVSRIPVSSLQTAQLP